MKAHFHTFLLLWLVALIVAERVSYDGYKAFSIAAGDNLEQIRDQISSFGYVSLGCKEGHSDHLNIAIPPDSISDFEALGLQATVISDDLGDDFAVESVFEPYIKKSASFKSGGAATPLPDLSWFNTYHDYADHRGFFEDLHAAFPRNSEIFTAGESYQDRDIYGLHFWGEGGKGNKPVIYFHATVHAREWIAAPVQEYLAWELISGYLGGDYGVRKIVDKYDFYMIPFVNPDGFVYTQSKDRLWRKTRQPRSGTTCVGTDGNRNWPYKWKVQGGASTEPCSEIYKGRSAGDTPEISAIVDFTKGLAESNDIKLFIDFHSYGQYILLPYGYDCDAVAENNKTQMKLAGEMAHQIFKVNGTEYTYGPSCSTLYPSTGTAPDYMAGKVGAEFAWTIELRPSWNGASGFVLPPQEILSTAQEMWVGIKYVLETM